MLDKPTEKQLGYIIYLINNYISLKDLGFDEIKIADKYIVCVKFADWCGLNLDKEQISDLITNLKDYLDYGDEQFLEEPKKIVEKYLSEIN